MIPDIAALEDYVRPRLFRVTNAAGKLLGSGFAIGGGVLTCSHVAQCCALGDLRVGGSRVLEITVGQNADASILKLEHHVGSLAVSTQRPALILAAGFPVELGLTGPIFSTDRISGSADISYVAGGRHHQSNGVWTLNKVLMSPGHSGGPVIDQQSGAVAGIVVANFRANGSHAGPSGFVLPMSKLLDDECLEEHIARAMRETPRYGLDPNELGANAWCRAATDAEIARISEERLYDRDSTIIRQGIDEELKKYLENSSSVWAIVDLSGLGKSTALVSIAERTTDRPVLLVRAMEVDDPSGLNGIVREKLAAVAPPYVSAIPNLSKLTNPGGAAPLIIIDGLNESGLDVAQMRDRWLPQAFRDAIGCKLVISCRPEHWQQISARIPTIAFHGQSNDKEGHGTSEFHLGEFTDDEWWEFVSKKFGDGSDVVQSLRHPLLLELAAALQDVPNLQTGQWDLLESWITRDCARAVDRTAAVTPRTAEDTLERIAAICLENGERTLSGKDPITRDAAFDPLLRQHLLTKEANRFGFRYDMLFEHLAARSLIAQKLTLSGGLWTHEGLVIDWAIVESLCTSLVRKNDLMGLDHIWSQLEYQHKLPGRNAVRILSILPVPIEREATALLLFEKCAKTRLGGISLAGINSAGVIWRHSFAIAVLHLAVRAASGYDFRDSDLFEPMRFYRNKAAFDFQGFKNFLGDLLSQERGATLEELAKWHEEQEELGAIWGDTTRESTVSSWTSCCFVFCSALLTDEELLSVPSPRHSRPVFVGLARFDPVRLLRLAVTLGSNPKADPVRLSEMISVLNFMVDRLDDTVTGQIIENFAVLACSLGLARYDDLENDRLRNLVLAWCACQPEKHDEAWHRLIELAEAGRADSVAPKAFLKYRPADVLDLARRLPHAFSTSSGNLLLDLAGSQFGSNEGVADDIATLRIDLLREYASVHGLDKRAGNVIEDLLHTLSIEQANRLGIMGLAIEASRQGGGASSSLVYFAGDQNRMLANDKMGLADRLAESFAEHADLHLADHVLMMRLIRLRIGYFDQSELKVLTKISYTIATRFGPASVSGVLENVSGLLEFLSPESKAAIVDAVRGELVNASWTV